MCFSLAELVHKLPSYQLTNITLGLLSRLLFFAIISIEFSRFGISYLSFANELLNEHESKANFTDRFFFTVTTMLYENVVFYVIYFFIMSLFQYSFLISWSICSCSCIGIFRLFCWVTHVPSFIYLLIFYCLLYRVSRLDVEPLQLIALRQDLAYSQVLCFRRNC